jgi:hypothetical protein
VIIVVDDAGLQIDMQSLKKLALLLLLVFTPCVCASAQHESQGYLPLTRAEVQKKFPVKYLGTLGSGSNRPGYFEAIPDKPLPARINIGPSGATLTEAGDNDLVIAGKDRRNKDWSIRLGDSVRSYSSRFYEADLDRNGTRDAVLVIPTGGNGLAPTNHLFAITFDERGRPLTFEADGYFEEVDEKIFDLVDLNQNGRAELIYMNYSDGYWITNIYEVRNARWQRVVGGHGTRVYPLYTRFTIRENHRPTTPKRGRHPFAPDLSNTSPRFAGRLVSYKWANVTQSEDISLTLRDKLGHAVVSKPASWVASFAILLDRDEGRQIVSLSAEPGAVKSLLETIIANHYEIALYGERLPGTSSPELMWAR